MSLLRESASCLRASNDEFEPFRLDPLFVANFAKKPVPFGFNGLGELVYMRTYSRLKKDGNKESWFETVERVVNGTYNMQKQWVEMNDVGWKPQKAQKSAQEMYERIFNLKFCPPGRGLWAMGSDITEKKRLHAALNNCAFVSTETISPNNATKPFKFLMDASMLGIGTGFDTKGAGKVIISDEPQHDSPTWIVDDSREGWVTSVEILLSQYLENGACYEFDYSKIRPAGMPIKSFGGVSSGPGCLMKLHESLRNVFRGRHGEALTVTDIVDIMNLIGVCVVSGNLRRCLPKGTLVHTKEGLIAIEKIKPGMLARTHDGFSSISELVHQGVQEVVTVKTQMADIQCTEKHRLAVLVAPGKYDWKRACDLKSGDCLVFVEPDYQSKENTCPLKNLPSREDAMHNLKVTTWDKLSILSNFDEEQAWFWGAFHGNGVCFVNKKNGENNDHISIDVHGDNIVMKNRCIQEIERYNVKVYVTSPCEENHCFRIVCPSEALAWYFSELNISNKSMVIPKAIMSGSKRIRSAYLAGEFDANGTYDTALVGSSTVYAEYARALQAVYASIGIPTQLEKSRQFSFQNSAIYNVKIVGARAQNLFEKLVAPFSSRFQETRQTKSSQNDYRFPRSWVQDASSRLSDSEYDSCDEDEPLAVDEYERLGGKNLKGLIPIEVYDVQYNGERLDTYDISVPDAKEFVFGPGILGHNTAEIAFGEPDSKEFMNLKNYDENPHRMAYGWTSNNSIYAEVGQDYHYPAELVCANGEPGFAWLENMKKYGRMGDPEDNKDFRVKGGNPCLEQSLESFEMCTLVETFPHRAESRADFLRTLKFAYLYAKTVTLGKTPWPETNRVMLRNRRIGCSMSGVTQFLEHNGLECLRQWCEEGYQTIQSYDKIYSEWLAIPRSIKTTSIKPSGTVSLLAGATPGMHYAISRYYIRRVRLDKNSDLVGPLRESGIALEPAVGQEETTVVASFPVDCGEGMRSAREVSMWEQVSLAAFLQRHWSDNQVSCTVSFDKKHEGPHIAHLLNYFQYHLKGISFLPNEDHNYPQLPYEPITKKLYKAKCRQIKPVKYKLSGGTDAVSEKFCNNDSCTK